MALVSTILVFAPAIILAAIVIARGESRLKGE